MSTTPSAITRSQGGAAHTPCHCHNQQPPPKECCCHLVCFERPCYFCGHMLTDADLSLEQKYFIEKNKLYHRTLDGYGVVCGLKLTCDPHCKGHILIHDGFAIDNCGNDLVVCETVSFDVITALRNKNLLVSEPEEDECEPQHKRPRCEIKQCFYVTVCYEEQESDFETPFQSNCTAGPKECLPTRTKERVRFDVTDKLPPQHSYIKSLEKRIKCCFEIYCEGPIGCYMKDHICQIRAIVEGKAEELYRSREETYWCDPCEIFCTLRAHFLHQLKLKPDEFRCDLVEEVSCLRCPEECWADEGRERYLCELKEVFCKLLTYMEQYQFDCVFGELIFCCNEPCEADCVVLGTVEVLDGKLIRVCNTPRKYVWSPANFIPVLIESLLNGALYKKPGEVSREEVKERCCPDYWRFDPACFLKEFEVNQCGRLYAATSALRAFDGVREALQRAFDFTDSRAVSPEIFKRLEPEQFKKAAESLGIEYCLLETNLAALRALDPNQALKASSLLRPEDSVVGYEPTSGDIIGRIYPNFASELSLVDSPEDSLTKAEFKKQMESYTKLLREQDRLIEKLTKDLEVVNNKLEKLEKPRRPNTPNKPKT